MRHSQIALEEMKRKGNPLTKYIEVSNMKNQVGIPPVIHFTIQSAPVGDVGVNGCQASDMLQYLTFLFKSLNDAVPNRETSITITKLEEALMWQAKRTADREFRDVEGTMNK